MSFYDYQSEVSNQNMRAKVEGYINGQANVFASNFTNGDETGQFKFGGLGSGVSIDENKITFKDGFQPTTLPLKFDENG